MGVNYSLMIYAPNFIQFSRPVTFFPVVSQPLASGISMRGIFHSDQIDVVLEDGSVFVDQRTSLDILDTDFSGMPMPAQLDRFYIAQDGAGGMAAVGTFEVVSFTSNAGGETNLILRKWQPTSLPAP
jgi:hypothetical protein